MTSITENSGKKPRALPKRLIRLAVVLVLLAGVAQLAIWLVQRSLRSPNKKRAVQSWLDEKLNADVSGLGDMSVRLNLIRPSNLVLRDVQVEHPNPLFDGRFAAVRRIEADVSILSLSRLWAGNLDLLLQGMSLSIEENDAGEWSTQGLMQPLSSPATAFPLPIPRAARCMVTIDQSDLTLRRRGYLFELDLNGEVSGSKGRNRFRASLRKMPFKFGRVDDESRYEGSFGPAAMSFLYPEAPGEFPLPIPGRCELSVEKLPVATLPFFAPGIPLDGTPGVFNGTITYQEHPAALGSIGLEGTLADVPLAVFGLPRDAPIRLAWPVMPVRDDVSAHIHIGPSGFGAFTVDIPLDQSGKPNMLTMKGDVAALDDLPLLLSKYSKWPDWLSRTFPAIEWRSGTWLGFGWNGTNMRLGLSRHTAGLNLNGEAEMMKGRVRLALNPEQADAPLTIAAERLDAQLMAVKLSQMLPEPFRAHLSGAHVNLTWVGSYDVAEGSISEWATGMVFAKPTIDVSASGSWWKGAVGLVGAIADALPEWGGGDDAPLRALADRKSIAMDQLSIVGEKDAEGGMIIEFRVYGDEFGQATGILEKRPDGTIEGEFLLAGTSSILDAVATANPELGTALGLLAHDSLGMRIVFRTDLDGNPVFSYPFLDDARLIHEGLTREDAPGQ